MNPYKLKTLLTTFQNTRVISSLKTITKNQKYKKIKKYVLNFMKRVI